MFYCYAEKKDSGFFGSWHVRLFVIDTIRRYVYVSSSLPTEALPNNISLGGKSSNAGVGAGDAYANGPSSPSISVAGNRDLLEADTSTTFQARRAAPISSREQYPGVTPLEPFLVGTVSPNSTQGVLPGGDGPSMTRLSPTAGRGRASTEQMGFLQRASFSSFTPRLGSQEAGMMPPLGHPGPDTSFAEGEGSTTIPRLRGNQDLTERGMSNGNLHLHRRNSTSNPLGPLSAQDGREDLSSFSGQSVSFDIPKSVLHHVRWKLKIKLEAVNPMARKNAAEGVIGLEKDVLRVELRGEERELAAKEAPPYGPLLCEFTGLTGGKERCSSELGDFIHDRFFQLEIFEALKEQFEELDRGRTEALAEGDRLFRSGESGGGWQRLSGSLPLGHLSEGGRPSLGSRQRLQEEMGGTVTSPRRKGRGSSNGDASGGNAGASSSTPTSRSRPPPGAQASSSPHGVGPDGYRDYRRFQIRGGARNATSPGARGGTGGGGWRYGAGGAGGTGGGGGDGGSSSGAGGNGGTGSSTSGSSLSLIQGKKDPYMPDVVMLIRFLSEYDYIRFLYCATSVLGQDKLTVKPYCGFPPFDPRNDLALNPLPPESWHFFRAMENDMMYLFMHGSVVGTFGPTPTPAALSSAPNRTGGRGSSFASGSVDSGDLRGSVGGSPRVTAPPSSPLETLKGEENSKSQLALTTLHDVYLCVTFDYVLILQKNGSIPLWVKWPFIDQFVFSGGGRPVSWRKKIGQGSPILMEESLSQIWSASFANGEASSFSFRGGSPIGARRASQFLRHSNSPRPSVSPAAREARSPRLRMESIGHNGEPFSASSISPPPPGASPFDIPSPFFGSSMPVMESAAGNRKGGSGTAGGSTAPPGGSRSLSTDSYVLGKGKKSVPFVAFLTSEANQPDIVFVPTDVGGKLSCFNAEDEVCRIHHVTHDLCFRSLKARRIIRLVETSVPNPISYILHLHRKRQLPITQQQQQQKSFLSTMVEARGSSFSSGVTLHGDDGEIPLREKLDLDVTTLRERFRRQPQLFSAAWRDSEEEKNAIQANTLEVVRHFVEMRRNRHERGGMGPLEQQQQELASAANAANSGVPAADSTVAIPIYPQNNPDIFPVKITPQMFEALSDILAHRRSVRRGIKSISSFEVLQLIENGLGTSTSNRGGARHAGGGWAEGEKKHTRHRRGDRSASAGGGSKKRPSSTSYHFPGSWVNGGHRLSSRESSVGAGSPVRRSLPSEEWDRRPYTAGTQVGEASSLRLGSPVSPHQALSFQVTGNFHSVDDPLAGTVNSSTSVNSSSSSGNGSSGGRAMKHARPRDRYAFPRPSPPPPFPSSLSGFRGDSSVTTNVSVRTVDHDGPPALPFSPTFPHFLRGEQREGSAPQPIPPLSPHWESTTGDIQELDASIRTPKRSDGFPKKEGKGAGGGGPGQESISSSPPTPSPPSLLGTHRGVVASFLPVSETRSGATSLRRRPRCNEDRSSRLGGGLSGRRKEGAREKDSGSAGGDKSTEDNSSDFSSRSSSSQSIGEDLGETLRGGVGRGGRGGATLPPNSTTPCGSPFLFSFQDSLKGNIKKKKEGGVVAGKGKKKMVKEGGKGGEEDEEEEEEEDVKEGGKRKGKGRSVSQRKEMAISLTTRLGEERKDEESGASADEQEKNNHVENGEVEENKQKKREKKKIRKRKIMEYAANSSTSALYASAMELFAEGGLPPTSEGNRTLAPEDLLQPFSPHPSPMDAQALLSRGKHSSSPSGSVTPFSPLKSAATAGGEGNRKKDVSHSPLASVEENAFPPSLSSLPASLLSIGDGKKNGTTSKGSPRGGGLASPRRGRRDSQEGRILSVEFVETKESKADCLQEESRRRGKGSTARASSPPSNGLLINSPTEFNPASSSSGGVHRFPRPPSLTLVQTGARADGPNATNEGEDEGSGGGRTSSPQRFLRKKLEDENGSEEDNGSTSKTVLLSSAAAVQKTKEGRLQQQLNHTSVSGVLFASKETKIGGEGGGLVKAEVLMEPDSLCSSPSLNISILPASLMSSPILVDSQPTSASAAPPNSPPFRESRRKGPGDLTPPLAPQTRFGRISSMEVSLTNQNSGILNTLNTSATNNANNSPPPRRYGTHGGSLANANVGRSGGGGNGPPPALRRPHAEDGRSSPSQMNPPPSSPLQAVESRLSYASRSPPLSRCVSVTGDGASGIYQRRSFQSYHQSGMFEEESESGGSHRSSYSSSDDTSTVSSLSDYFDDWNEGGEEEDEEERRAREEERRVRKILPKASRVYGKPCFYTRMEQPRVCDTNALPPSSQTSQGKSRMFITSTEQSSLVSASSAALGGRGGTGAAAAAGISFPHSRSVSERSSASAAVAAASRPSEFFSPFQPLSSPSHSRHRKKHPLQPTQDHHIILETSKPVIPSGGRPLPGKGPRATPPSPLPTSSSGSDGQGGGGTASSQKGKEEKGGGGSGSATRRPMRKTLAAQSQEGGGNSDLLPPPTTTTSSASTAPKKVKAVSSTSSVSSPHGVQEDGAGKNERTPRVCVTATSSSSSANVLELSIHWNPQPETKKGKNSQRPSSVDGTVANSAAEEKVNKTKNGENKKSEENTSTLSALGSHRLQPFTSLGPMSSAGGKEKSTSNERSCPSFSSSRGFFDPPQEDEDADDEDEVEGEKEGGGDGSSLGEQPLQATSSTFTSDTTTSSKRKSAVSFAPQEEQRDNQNSNSNQRKRKKNMVSSNTKKKKKATTNTDVVVPKGQEAEQQSKKKQEGKKITKAEKGKTPFSIQESSEDGSVVSEVSRCSTSWRSLATLVIFPPSPKGNKEEKNVSGKSPSASTDSSSSLKPTTGIQSSCSGRKNTSTTGTAKAPNTAGGGRGGGGTAIKSTASTSTSNNSSFSTTAAAVSNTKKKKTLKKLSAQNSFEGVKGDQPPRGVAGKSEGEHSSPLSTAFDLSLSIPKPPGESASVTLKSKDGKVKEEAKMGLMKTSPECSSLTGQQSSLHISPLPSGKNEEKKSKKGKNDFELKNKKDTSSGLSLSSSPSPTSSLSIQKSHEGNTVMNLSFLSPGTSPSPSSLSLPQPFPVSSLPPAKTLHPLPVESEPHLSPTLAATVVQERAKGIPEIEPSSLREGSLSSTHPSRSPPTLDQNNSSNHHHHLIHHTPSSSFGSRTHDSTTMSATSGAAMTTSSSINHHHQHNNNNNENNSVFYTSPAIVTDKREVSLPALVNGTPRNPSKSPTSSSTRSPRSTTSTLSSSAGIGTGLAGGGGGGGGATFSISSSSNNNNSSSVNGSGVGSSSTFQENNTNNSFSSLNRLKFSPSTRIADISFDRKYTGKDDVTGRSLSLRALQQPPLQHKQSLLREKQDGSAGTTKGASSPSTLPSVSLRSLGTHNENTAGK